MKKMLSVFVLLLLCGCQQTAKQPTQDSTPTPSPVNISLIAVGDNLIHSSVYNDAAALAASNPNRDYDFLPMYQHVAERIENADIAFFNQETALGGTELGVSDYPMFNSPQELGEDMISLGFDVVNHACNHIYDRGEEGIANTIEFWKNHPEVTMLGITDGTYPEIQYTETKGIKIAWMGYGYGTNGLELPEDSQYSMFMLDDDRICQAAREARKNADLVIVSLHWGNEYQMEPSAEQQVLASKLSRENVDLIIGHHPHVIQPMKSITRPDGKEMLIAYSLGNFVSAQDMANSMLEGMIEVEFSGVPGDMQVSMGKFIPLINHFAPGYSNFVIYPFDEYSAELADSHGVRSFDSVFS
ncbi:MAG: CapA family protein [Ruminococcaceae bacterium]|nr:CapA family protein [Oscillospiraceae bacterium]